MRAVLADDCLSQNLPVVGHKRRRTVVAGGFEAQDDSHFAPGPLPHPWMMH
jgi:hypothetical protein